MENQAEKIKELLIEIKRVDTDLLERATVDIRRTEHSSMVESLTRLVDHIFKTYRLNDFFSGECVDIGGVVKAHMLLRELLIKEKIRCIKAESNLETLAGACLSGDMSKIEPLLAVLGRKPPPGDTTTH